MIVKRLRMENFRSYRRAEVEFPGGKTLFEGDIGSGKSTILMAVEFALFGLGNARASSLLKFGENRGSVELEFEAGGKEYSVRRVLARKGGSIQQVEGKLRGPDGEEDYPPTEMKEKILEILNFRESTEPRSRSLIYQYAIYSRQEEMKLILELEAGERVSILRRAFGLEEYKTAMENAEELLRKIQAKRSQFEVASREIPALKKEMADAEESMRRGEHDLVSLRASEAAREESVARLDKQKEEMHELEMQLANALADQKHLAKDIERHKQEAESADEELETLDRKSARLNSNQAGAPPTEKTVEELKAAMAATRKAIARHEASEAEMGTKISQFESVAEWGRCPVCDREAKPADYVMRATELAEKRKANSGHIESLNLELESLEAVIDKRRVYDSAVAAEKESAGLAEDYARESSKRSRQLATARAGVEAGEKSMADLEKRVRVLKEETKELEAIRKRLDSARRELGQTEEKIAGLRSDFRKWEADAKRCAESIARKERSAAKATALREREIWLEEFFVPTLAAIERHVMVSINREFDASFQRWFGILMEGGGKEARVDEDFTPLVEQEGYEQEVESLSGGERTSVALAYRLALSQIVQRHAEAGPSSLILDEPTDGFSKEQLGKVREILDEMANPQVIIVSHERELESMADQIYRVAKVGNESKITR